MKIRDLTGKQHIWNLAQYAGKSRANATGLHLRAIKLLRSILPTVVVLEEVYLPNMDLYLDIYLPSLRLAVEVQGEQHTNYSLFFHNRNPKNFNKSKQRDQIKKSWCDLNNIKLITFDYSESEDQWQAKLRIGSKS